MNTDDPLFDNAFHALRSLAESDREKEASPEVEVRLRRAFRQTRRKSDWRNAGASRIGLRRPGARNAATVSAVAASLAAIMIAAIVLGTMHRKTDRGGLRPAAPEPARGLASASERPGPPLEPQVDSAAVPAPKPKVRPVSETPAREIVTEFFPLIDVAPPFERGELLRVNVPAAAMRTVGLPVSEEHLADPVQADVLVGEEGLPRAIRFVRSLN